MRSLSLLALTLFSCGPGALTVTSHQVQLNAGSSTALVVQVQPPQVLTVTLTATNGAVVQDPQLSLDTNGTGVTQLTSATAGDVVVTAKTGAVQATTTVKFLSNLTLRFTSYPTTTATQNLLRPTPTVILEDNGTAVTSSSAQVSIAVTPGSCTASLDATSLTTATLNQGTASFPGLKITTPATGCTLTATTSGLSAVSPPFDVVP